MCNDTLNVFALGEAIYLPQSRQDDLFRFRDYGARPPNAENEKNGKIFR